MSIIGGGNAAGNFKKLFVLSKSIMLTGKCIDGARLKYITVHKNYSV